MSDVGTLLTGLAFPESPRWHDHRLWLSDWGAQEVIAVDLEGESDVVARVESFPFCIDFLPDGRLLIVSARDRRILRRGTDGSLVTHADLSGLSEKPWTTSSSTAAATRMSTTSASTFRAASSPPASSPWSPPRVQHDR